MALEEDTVFIIGGREFRAPPMSFYTLERAWPHIEATTASKNNIEQTSAALGILSAALSFNDDGPSVDQLKRLLKPSEMRDVLDQTAKLMRVSGFHSGEVAATSSTETSPTSSQSLSPTEFAAETGIEFIGQ